jgi:ubiquinone/menaquinone biosynthesis C-methylase UbiE
MKNIIDLLLGRRKEFTPSRKMINSIGGGNFKKVGEHFLKHFIELGNLKPGEKVLDVGCGVGRMAVPLAKYLDKNGSYEGFDIVAEGITWCTEKISHEYPNFHFQLADVYNKNYNPNGKYKAAEYKFPFENESFDFVFLTSVFTHMLPADMENYFSEIARVLKRGGRSLITFFLLNKESLELINAGKSTQDFKYQLEGYTTKDMNTPEAAVAYNEEFIYKIYEKYGLKLTEPIRYGSWCGRKDFLSYQDIVIASKK